MKQIVVLGGGPAGYVAALRAAQLGAQVTLVESARLGGTCLNVGCIPTKTLVHTARSLEAFEHSMQQGILLPGRPSLDFSKVMERKASVVQRLVGGLSRLLTQKKVRVIQGQGKLAPGRTVLVTNDGKQLGTLKADAVILCTGSQPVFPRGLAPDGEWVISSTEALSLTKVPGALAIVGGGVIGVEFAYIYRRLGSAVTVIEQEPNLLPLEDAEAGEAIARQLRKSGVSLQLASRVTGLDRTSRRVGISHPAGAETAVQADVVLVATGRRPRLPEFEGTKGDWPATEHGVLVVNSFLETTAKGVYGAGDVTGLSQLAHAAFEQGALAAENAVLETRKAVNPAILPRCVYTTPEVASVGLSEAEARLRYDDVMVGRFPMAANGKALADAAEEGFTKVVARRKHGQVLGITMVGENASDIIGQGVLALQLEATLDELAGVIAPHPSISETLKEAALHALGRAIHI